MTSVSSPAPAAAPPPLPPWAPEWAHRLTTTARAGTTAVFVVHGNTHDLMPLAEGADAAYGQLATFLAEQVFGRYDLVLHYDLSRGLRAFGGRSVKRLQDMVTLAADHGLLLDGLKNDPALILQVLDGLIQKIVLTANNRLKLAVLIDHASFLFPSGEPGRMSVAGSSMLVTVLNWAASPHLKALDIAVLLIDERKSDLSERMVGNPHVAAQEIPLPDQAERQRFLSGLSSAAALGEVSDFAGPELAKLTAGLSLTNLRSLVLPALKGGSRLDRAMFRAMKKRLLEQQAQGLLEFIEPKWTLDTVVGLVAAKRRLREDAALLAKGHLDAMPMGYLICGPVGTGKSFLVQCAAGEIGIPCVMLKNFRSKYVGETEGNLERVLAVLRAMGPIMVVVDEADAALGDRDQEGDAGTGSRVFAMISNQMGDTRYRGQILWMLLTARPDLLPIDIKRQGRAEVHIPLFYPTEEKELREMFVALARKNGTSVEPEDIPKLPTGGNLSGSDIEGMVTRAWRASLIQGAAKITREALHNVVEQFMPSSQGLERELQELAALLECTDRDFLTPAAAKKLDANGGRSAIQQRLAEVRRLIEFD